MILPTWILLKMDYQDSHHKTAQSLILVKTAKVMKNEPLLHYMLNQNMNLENKPNLYLVQMPTVKHQVNKNIQNNNQSIVKPIKVTKIVQMLE